jgi:hypothetical protein
MRCAACGPAARGAPAAVSGRVDGDCWIDAGGATGVNPPGDFGDDGVTAAPGDRSGSVALLAEGRLPGSVATGNVALGTGSPETGPVGTGPVGTGADGGGAVGDSAGVVGPGSKGRSGTQNPPPPTGTCPAGHGPAAAVAGEASTPMRTADHTASMPKTIRPVSTSYNATRLPTGTVGPSAGTFGPCCSPDLRRETW